jgi:hypothetical protein
LQQSHGKNLVDDLAPARVGTRSRSCH